MLKYTKKTNLEEVHKKKFIFKRDSNYTGMAYNDYGWWYFVNGQLDFNYTGMASNEYGWWYITNGALDLTYTGTATNEYGEWQFVNGYIIY